MTLQFISIEAKTGDSRLKDGCVVCVVCDAVGINNLMVENVMMIRDTLGLHTTILSNRLLLQFRPTSTTTNKLD